MKIRFLFVIVFATVGLAFSGTTPGAQMREKTKIETKKNPTPPTFSLTQMVRIKFSGTGTCIYINSSGTVRLKPGQTLPTCDPNDTALIFERTALGGTGRTFRHIDTNLCLQITNQAWGQLTGAVVGMPCTAQDQGFALFAATGGKVQFRQSFNPPKGLCCVLNYCLSVTGAGGSQNLAVLLGTCTDSVPTRFTLEPV
jgi:hypothetical protein